MNLTLTNIKEKERDTRMYFFFMYGDQECNIKTKIVLKLMRGSSHIFLYFVYIFSPFLSPLND